MQKRAIPVTIETFGELTILFIVVWALGAEICRDLLFYFGNGFDLNEQRASNIFKGYIVKTGASVTARSRFFFWHPVFVLFSIVLVFRIFGIF